MFAPPFDPAVELLRICRISPVTIPATENKTRFLPHALGLVLALACFLSVGESALATASEGAAPRELRCESMGNPLGIDIAHPLLSWQLQDARRGARQTAYQIRVASSADALAQGDVWDSGQVSSAQSVNVAYAGTALESRRRYYWQVRVWDQQGQASAYSEASWWEMGLLSPQDWKAKWITHDLPVERGDYESGVKWIWDATDHGLTTATPGKHEFRFRLNLQERPQEGILFVTGKDNMAAWVNGKQVLEAEPVMGYGPRHPWGYFRVIAVSQLLTKGGNELAAEVVVDETRGGAPHPVGLIAMLRLRMPDGKILRFFTGPDWKAAAGQSGTDWVTTTFDDSSWSPAAAIADVGQGPLGTPWPALPASLLRRKFTLAKQVRSARIYSTALGSYQLLLNGGRVGNDVLAPGWTDYRKRVVYQVYDVTSQVKQGNNAIGAILGGGWTPTRYLVPARSSSGRRRFDCWCTEVEDTDGTRDSIATDESWRATQSPIGMRRSITARSMTRASSRRGGTSRPSRTHAGAPLRSHLRPEAALVAQDFQPMRVEESLKPKTMTNPAPGVFIFDLGQNMVGMGAAACFRPRGN